MKTASYTFLLLCFLSFITILSCQKNTNPNPGTQTEENLVVETTPTTLGNHVESPAPGPDFPLRVSIKSKMPAGGVKIDVTARQETATTPFFTDSKSNSLAENTFTITSTPRTVVIVLQVTVTSLSKSTNVWTGSYRYSRK